MSNLNLNILVQSVENLSQQVEKSEASAQQDKISLDKAQALLEGLKGMFGIQSITMENAGDFLSIVATISEHRAQFYMDPSKQLKLCGVKVIITLLAVHADEALVLIFFVYHLLPFLDNRPSRD